MFRLVENQLEVSWTLEIALKHFPAKLSTIPTDKFDPLGRSLLLELITSVTYSKFKNFDRNTVIIRVKNLNLFRDH